MNRTTAALTLSAGLILATVPVAFAGGGKGHDRPAVCHPTGKGYVLIRPAQASSHIDESAYPNGHYWRHEHSGRHDVYAVNGTCPGAPTPTTTGGTPSSPSTTMTSVPTTATSTTSANHTKTTTTHPSPSTTSSTPTTDRTPPTTTVSAPSHPRPHGSPSVASPVPSSSTAASHPTSAPSSTGELARTGTELTNWAVLGVFLLAVGGLVLAFRRILGGGR